MKATMEKPLWLKMDEAELKKIIAELATKNGPAKVGLILRDQYGVPTTKVFGKKLGVYLKELGINTNEELERVTKKAEKLSEHFKKNITDKKAKHKMQKAHSRASVLRRHYAKD